MNQTDGVKIEINRSIIVKAVFSAALALFAVVFLWGFWSKGPESLGLNFFVFSAAFIIFLVYSLAKEKNYGRKDLFWIMPFLLISLSFFLYNNLFTKSINFFVMPWLFIFFLALAFMADKDGWIWGRALFFRVFMRVLSFFDKINDACVCYFRLVKIKNHEKSSLLLRVLIGIIFFILIASGIILPLLSSVDPIFALKVKKFYELLPKFFTPDLIGKVVVFIVLAVFFLASILAWWKRYSFEDKKEAGKKGPDVVVTTIIVGGVFLIYLLFIAIQLKRLWLGNLPIDFSETVNLVKSGFWQLFFLSIVNVLIFLSSFRQINKSFQVLLGLFTASSLLLLFSSAWRMYLYVYNYGFSYEKFYSSYTVLYSFLVFAILLASFAFKQKLNFLKIFAFTFLWLYSLTTVLPLEHFILSANLKLKERPESRIRIAELAMLSPDVLGAVKIEVLPSGVEAEIWRNWVAESERSIANKKWYEFCLLDIKSKIK